MKYFLKYNSLGNIDEHFLFENVQCDRDSHYDWQETSVNFHVAMCARTFHSIFISTHLFTIQSQLSTKNEHLRCSFIFCKSDYRCRTESLSMKATTIDQSFKWNSKIIQIMNIPRKFYSTKLFICRLLLLITVAKLLISQLQITMRSMTLVTRKY